MIQEEEMRRKVRLLFFGMPGIPLLREAATVVLCLRKAIFSLKKQTVEVNVQRLFAALCFL